MSPLLASGFAASLGVSIVPWPAIGESLRRVGFGGWLILELNREIRASPEALMRAREQLLSGLG